MPFDTTLDPTTDVFLGAILYIEHYGWNQGSAASGIRRCVWAAMREMAGANTALMLAVGERFERANKIRHGRVSEWNNEPGRTEEQVLDALRNSI